MTEDTKRALDMILPIAKELGINRIHADDDALYVEDSIIGITYNSTSATLWEFIGYLILEYQYRRRDLKLTDEQIKTITRNWAR